MILLIVDQGLADFFKFYCFRFGHGGSEYQF